MPRSYSRKERVADLIQTALAKILLNEASEFNLGMVTVTHVKLSPDLSFAKIFVSVLEENTAKEVITTLNEESKHFRYLLAQDVKLRITPELKFIYDDSALQGQHISSLINSALKK